MEIDNENIWIGVNNLTSACQRTVVLVYVISVGDR